MNYNSAFFSSKVPPNGDIPVKSLNEQIQKQKQTIIKVIWLFFVQNFCYN